MKKNKIALLIGSIAMALSVSGCSIVYHFDTDTEEDVPVDPTPTTPTNDEGVVYDKATKIAPAYTYNDLGNNDVYAVDYCPTIGNPKLLIIPIWFSDSFHFIYEDHKEIVREDISKAYLGTSEETGWHSVSSFYEQESSGKLKLDGTVSDWYEVGQSYKTFGPEDTGGSATETLVTTATNWYFDNNPSDSRKNYDCDSNGWLDGVLLIYAAPNYASLDRDNYGNLWAYCFWLQNYDSASVARPTPNAFFWASYDFMYSNGSYALSKTGASKYGYGDTSHCLIDAHTYIHEMGHIFGLQDYYDYSNKTIPAGGFSMQDFNVGGHEAYSVFALGWAEPYVLSGSDEITIGTFEKTRELILISPKWNKYNSPFDEYILLELYSPTGLNEFDSKYSYSGYGQFGPTKTGIRMWHVDSRVCPCYNADADGYPIYREKHLTANPIAPESSYGVSLAFSNTIGIEGYCSVLGSEYDNNKLLHLIRNDKNVNLNCNNNITNSDLFLGDGSTYSLTDYSKQFAGGTKFNNGNSLDYSINITISGSGADAQAKVVITQN